MTQSKFTQSPVPTDIVLLKFMNGFQNGFIIQENWTSNIQDVDAQQYDLDFLVSVWRYGAYVGAFFRQHRNN